MIKLNEQTNREAYIETRCCAQAPASSERQAVAWAAIALEPWRARSSWYAYATRTISPKI